MDRPARLLVVDNDLPTRRLLTAALVADGQYEIVAARNADEALTALRAPPGFDLLLTEVFLPGGSGIELVRTVRATDSRIPVLMLTSVQSDETVARALACGADDYLHKPVDLRKLRSAIADLIERRRATAHAVEAGGGMDQTGAPVRLQASEPVVRHTEEGEFVELTSLTDALLAERFQRFAERLLTASLSEKARQEVRLALEEIVRNAIEWGNRNDPHKALRLSYCLLADRITFRIEDQGGGFNHGALNDPSADPQAHIRSRRASGKRMGGWGIFLARKMVDEVTFNPRGNVVFLTKYLRRAGANGGCAPVQAAPLPPPPAPPPPAGSRGKATRVVHRQAPGVKD
jgi:DNA-binding response OmpR family regulator